VRRSSSGASDRRQDSAAICRSASVIVTCASFSASTNVAGVTGGPDNGPVPNVGGAPGVFGDGADPLAAAGAGAGGCDSDRQAAAALSTPIGAVIRNFRRVFMRNRIGQP
jgi:hypothetical protein